MKLLKVFTLTTATVLCTQAVADSKWVRLSWFNDPATQATISFSPEGSNNNPYIRYGLSTNETNWSTQPVTFTQTLDGLESKHTKLTGLTPNSPVYFKVCDDAGCSEAYWFQTAPTDEGSFVAVAGGDTRTGWTNRQAGNRLVAKIRPLVVLHGGDYTDVNNYSQWQQWLTDWDLTQSQDVIEGTNYRRVYPLVATHGNHEDSDLATICKVFGVDTNNDLACNEHDSYYGFNVSPLLRVYTLNSQFYRESSTLQNQQNSWFYQDLSEQANTATWRIAQYHKPMFPHYTGKTDRMELFDWWAQSFYDHAVNLVVESDTHITKLTKVVKPTSNNFVEATAGTVYVGEGSWGAPARSADNPKSWTIDLASIQQFKVLTISPDQMQVRTAQFDDSAQTLTHSQRQQDSTLLPSGINWWQANGVGEALILKQDSNGRTIQAQSSSTSVNLASSDDAFIARDLPDNNYNTAELLVDANDSLYGKMESVIKWDLNGINSCATITNASITLSVFDSSDANFEYLINTAAWDEQSVTWNSIYGAPQTLENLASWQGANKGEVTISIEPSKLSLIQQWLSGENQGVLLRSSVTGNGMDARSNATSSAPTLSLTIDESSCEPAPEKEMTLSAAEDSFISSALFEQNYEAAPDQLLADRYDSVMGELMTLIKWDTSALASCIVVSGAEIELTVFDTSTGDYGLYQGENSWQASTVTWQSVSGDSHKGNEVASFIPTSKTRFSLSLNSDGIDMINQWLAGNNNGVVLSSKGTTNGVDIRDIESGAPASLILHYQDSNCP